MTHNFLDHCSRKYYEGDPIISDEEFDALAKQHNFKYVGYEVTKSYPHSFRMYSLQKLTPTEEKDQDVTGWIKTVKLDGAAIALTYLNGALISVMTRGDGIHGKSVTHLFQNTEYNSDYIMPIQGLVQVTGELVAPKRIRNARNYAAGALSLKDVHEFDTRELSFYAYDVQGDILHESWTERLEWLEKYGWKTILLEGLDNIYPTDGYVWRVNNIKEFTRMGYTTTHPRGAFAVKEEQKPVVTTLREVRWQLGKSGVVSPVAHFDAVEIGHAIITKATLHNIDYIRNLGLELGCKILVVRSGEIIPRVVGRYDEQKNNS